MQSHRIRVTQNFGTEILKAWEWADKISDNNTSITNLGLHWENHHITVFNNLCDELKVDLTRNPVIEDKKN